MIYLLNYGGFMNRIIMLALIIIFTYFEYNENVVSNEIHINEITNMFKKKHSSKLLTLDELTKDHENKNIGIYEIYEVTAYTANKESTGKSKGDPDYGITASGTVVKNNQTLACPKNMKFGTKVYIPYFDVTFICEDRGGSITDRRLDVYMEDLQDALDFGRRKLEVKVLE